MWIGFSVPIQLWGFPLTRVFLPNLKLCISTLSSLHRHLQACRWQCWSFWRFPWFHYHKDLKNKKTKNPKHPECNPLVGQHQQTPYILSNRTLTVLTLLSLCFLLIFLMSLTMWIYSILRSSLSWHRSNPKNNPRRLVGWISPLLRSRISPLQNVW